MIILFFALLTTLSVRAEVINVVHLKGEAFVHSQQVCLDDLSADLHVQNRCAENRKKCCSLTLEGQHAKNFSKFDIESALRKISQNSDNFQIEGIGEVRVTQTHRQLGADELRSKILEKLQHHSLSSQGLLQLRELSPSGMLLVSLDSKEWDVQLPETLAQSNLVKVVSGGSLDPALVGWVRVKVALEDQIYVSNKPIHSKELLKIEDFQLQKIDLLSPDLAHLGAFLRDGNFPSDSRVRMSVLPGVPLTRQNIEKIPLIQMGEAVTLILRGENLRLTTKGLSQGTGAEGDMISVQLKPYGRILRGKLMASKAVEVWL